MYPDDKIMKTRAQIVCLNCGKIFDCGRRAGNRKFCDINCRHAFYGEKMEEIAPKINIIKKCKFCNKEFECSSSTPNRVFCSYSCSKLSIQSKKKKLVEEKRYCLNCGNEFIWSSSKPDQKYCSQECVNNFHAKTQTKEIRTEVRSCSICGKAFEWFSNKPSQKYCSVECRRIATQSYSKSKSKVVKDDDLLRDEIYIKVLEIVSKMNQTQGNTFGDRYIDYWQTGSISEKTRDEVLERDGYECQICRRKDSLHLHHLIKRRNGGDHKADNLITLCASCHGHIETGDVEYATNKCYKNATRHYGESSRTSHIDSSELKERLTALFGKIKNSTISDDTEVLVCLDEIIDSL